jgi:SAM-dependent methyltransferase
MRVRSVADKRREHRSRCAIADIGGGPGRYALWLAELGYQVEHRDLMPLHVQQLRDEATGIEGLHTAVCDARDLDLDDDSVDAVLLLGPSTICVSALTVYVRSLKRAGSCGQAARYSRPRSRAGSRGFSTCVSNCIWIIRSLPPPVRNNSYRVRYEVTGVAYPA